MTILLSLRKQYTAIGAVALAIASAILTRGLRLPRDNQGWSYP